MVTAPRTVPAGSRAQATGCGAAVQSVRSIRFSAPRLDARSVPSRAVAEPSTSPSRSVAVPVKAGPVWPSVKFAVSCRSPVA